MRYVERVASQFRAKAGLEDPIVEDKAQDPVEEEGLGFGVSVGTADED